MTLFLLPNQRDHARMGVVASRKLGGAVRRNRAKRLVRELFRQNKVTQGLDIVVVARRELLEASYDSLEADYRAALRRCTRMNPQP